MHGHPLATWREMQELQHHLLGLLVGIWGTDSTFWAWSCMPGWGGKGAHQWSSLENGRETSRVCPALSPLRMLLWTWRKVMLKVLHPQAPAWFRNKPLFLTLPVCFGIKR